MHFRNAIQKPSADAGFTLIEISAVLVIIGILVIAGFPMFSEGQVGAKRNSCLDRQHMIFEAALIYCSETIPPDGPLSVSALHPDLLQPSGGDCPAGLDGSGDDYSITIVDGAPTDVICNILGDGHPWDPH